MKFLLGMLLLLPAGLKAQSFESDSVMLRQVFDEALTNGHAYENLRSLCKGVGHRLSGSPGAEQAVQWGEQLMHSYGFDSVYLQPVEVPHWVRGSEEEAWITFPDGSREKLHISSLGGSVGTDGTLEAEVIEVKHLEDLEKLGREAIEGKIVFFNRAMDPTNISTFRSYGGCYDQRAYGASEAGKFGAVAVLVRSLTLNLDYYPHTGSMRYGETDSIPAAGISTRDAVRIKQLINANEPFKVTLRMSCENRDPVISYNVIGELRGNEFPDEIILIGGHLDSWDIGEGAHDDGSGVIHSLEAVRLLMELGYQPRRTLRVVFFMNEENGNNGGKMYAQVAREKNEEHIVAIESDRGGFVPRGFSLDGTPEQLELLQQFSELFEPYNIHLFKEGYGGVDISPLKDGRIALIGLVPDSQRYFDHHHAQTDVFESVNKRELELGSAACAGLIYLLDRHYGMHIKAPRR